MEVSVYRQPYSRFYALRAVFLLKYFKPAPMPKELKIFVKAILHFAVYLPAYMIIMGAVLLTLNAFALNVLEEPAYLDDRLIENSRDNYLKYLLTSMKIVLATDWGQVRSGH